MANRRTAEFLELDADAEVRLDEELIEGLAAPRRRGRSPAASAAPATREDLVDYISRDLDCSKAVAKAVVGSVCKGIVELSYERGLLRLGPLGNFRILSVQPRAGRNPRTGEPVPISAGNRVVFRAARAFKDIVNGAVPRRYGS